MKQANETRWLELGLLAAALTWAPACDDGNDGGSAGNMPALGTSATGPSTPDDDGSGGSGGSDDSNGEGSDGNETAGPDDDDGPGGDGMDGGSSGAADDPSATSASGDDAGSSGAGDDDSGDPPDSGMPNPVQECLDTAADSCQECGCNSCFAEFDACEADIGCVVIRICAENAMCSDVDCIGPCGDVINDNGGPFGEPLAKLMALGDCMEASCDDCLGG